MIVQSSHHQLEESSQVQSNFDFKNNTLFSFLVFLFLLVFFFCSANLDWNLYREFSQMESRKTKTKKPQPHGNSPFTDPCTINKHKNESFVCQKKSIQQRNTHQSGHKTPLFPLASRLTPPHTYTMHELFMDKDEPRQTNKEKAKDTVPWACGERWKSWSFPWWTPCGCPWRCDLWPRGAWGPPRPSCASWGPGSAACEPRPATSSWVSMQASTGYAMCMGFCQSCVYKGFPILCVQGYSSSVCIGFCQFCVYRVLPVLCVWGSANYVCKGFSQFCVYRVLPVLCVQGPTNSVCIGFYQFCVFKVLPILCVKGSTSGVCIRLLPILSV